MLVALAAYAALKVLARGLDSAHGLQMLHRMHRLGGGGYTKAPGDQRIALILGLLGEGQVAAIRLGLTGECIGEVAHGVGHR